MPRRDEGLVWSQVRVGVVAVLAIIVVLFSIIMVGKLLNLFAKRYTLVTLVPSAAGLPPGAPVTLAGQRIGQVDGIDFIPLAAKRGDKNILIRLAIAREVAEQIRRDSRATMRTQGLLGDRYIDIAPGTPRTPALTPGDTVPMQPAIDMDLLLTSAGQALDSARLMMADLRAVTRSISSGQGTLGKMVTDDELYRSTSEAMAQLHVTLAQLNDPRGSLGRMVHDPTLYNRLVGAVGRVDSLAAMVAAGQGSLGKLLTRDEIYTGLLGTVQRADTAMGGLAAMSRAFNSGNGSMQRLLRDPGLYDQFLKAVVDLQTLINDVRAQPKKYRPDINVKVF